MDVADMTNSPHNNRSVLVIINRFSKLLGVDGIKCVDEQTIYKPLLRNWIFNSGKPMSRIIVRYMKANILQIKRIGSLSDKNLIPLTKIHRTD